MTTATCVIDRTGHFTALEDYKVHAHFGNRATVESDSGHLWNVRSESDGYYGCHDANGNHVSFYFGDEL